MWKEVEEFIDRSAKEILFDIEKEFVCGGLDEEEFKDKMRWIYEDPHNAKLVLERSQQVSAFWDGITFESWDDFMNSDRKLNEKINSILQEL